MLRDTTPLHVPAAIYTSAGWIRGTLVIPRPETLAEHLDHCGPFLRLEDVRLPGDRQHAPEMALRRDSAILVLPEPGTRAMGGSAAWGDVRRAATRRRPVTCLVHLGLVSGDVDLNRPAEVTELVVHHAGFVLVRHAHIYARGQDGWSSRGPFAAVLVNAARIGGVLEGVAHLARPVAHVAGRALRFR